MGVVPGKVVRFCEDQGPGKPRLKVPHMGWNAIGFAADSPLFAGLSPGDHVYFVHGYYCKPADQSQHRPQTTSYGHDFCAAVHRDNLWAMQFHPEKSAARRIADPQEFCGGLAMKTQAHNDTAVFPLLADPAGYRVCQWDLASETRLSAVLDRPVPKTTSRRCSRIPVR